MTVIVAVVFVVAGTAGLWWLRESNARWLDDHRGRHHE